MVNKQIERRGIKNKRILDAFIHTPRHLFVSHLYQNQAYEDRPLPIGSGQTISQPYIVALMTQLANPQADHTVLEIGTGSGYQAAILGHLVKKVFSIEQHLFLIQKADLVIQQLNYCNIDIIYGDGSQGLPDEAPFDSIIITAAAPELPPNLISQLKVGGRIIAPVGDRGQQILSRWTLLEDSRLEKEDITPVAFVPLRGKHGWMNDVWPQTD